MFPQDPKEKSSSPAKGTSIGNRKLVGAISVIVGVLLIACGIDMSPITITPTVSSPDSDNTDLRAAEIPPGGGAGQATEGLSEVGTTGCSSTDKLLAREVYQRGEPALVGDDLALVAGWFSPTGFGFGSSDIAVQVILVNTSNGPKNYGYSQAVLKDTAGNIINPGESGDYPELGATDVLPGERISGTIVFTLPAGSQPDVLTWTGYSVNGQEQAAFEIGRHPGLIVVPPLLFGECRQPASAIGTVVAAGPIDIVVNEVLIDRIGNQIGVNSEPEPNYKFLYVSFSIIGREVEVAEEPPGEMLFQDLVGGYYPGISDSVHGFRGNCYKRERGESLLYSMGCWYRRFEIPLDASEGTFVFTVRRVPELIARVRFPVDISREGDGVYDVSDIPELFASIDDPRLSGWMALGLGASMDLDFVSGTAYSVPERRPTIHLQPSHNVPKPVVLVRQDTLEEIPALVSEVDHQGSDSVDVQPRSDLADGFYCVRIGPADNPLTSYACFEVRQ